MKMIKKKTTENPYCFISIIIPTDATPAHVVRADVLKVDKTTAIRVYFKPVKTKGSIPSWIDKERSPFRLQSMGEAGLKAIYLGNTCPDLETAQLALLEYVVRCNRSSIDRANQYIEQMMRLRKTIKKIK